MHVEFSDCLAVGSATRRAYQVAPPLGNGRRALVESASFAEAIGEAGYARGGDGDLVEGSLRHHVRGGKEAADAVLCCAPVPAQPLKRPEGRGSGR